MNKMAAPNLECLVENFHARLGFLKHAFVIQRFIKNSFRNVSNDNRNLEEMFSFIWSLEEAHECLTPFQVYSEKSEADADRLREKGNEYYKRKNFHKALELYNLSILTAPHPPVNPATTLKDAPLEGGDIELETANGVGHSDSTQETYRSLAWGYSNRSAVLLVLKKYKLCLRDIDLALKYGEPMKLQSKLEERRLKCLAAQKKTQSSCNNVDVTSARTALLPKLGSCNPSMPALSSAIKLAFTPEKGRHLVATRNIRPGELLGVEESYCNTILPDYLHSYCSTCLMACQAPLPCPNCSMVMFCSSACRAKGLEENHRLECNILPSLTALDISDSSSLTYKMLSRTPYAELKRLMPQLQRETKYYPLIKRGFSKDGKYCASDYRSVYHLVTNKDKISSQELYHRCLTAFVLNKVLEQSGKYFVNEQGDPFPPSQDDLVMTGAVLFIHLLQVECNYHPQGSAKVSDVHKKKDLEMISIGTFPTLSLMNHSCIPSTTYYNYGRTIVLRSLKSIPAGAEVTECYTLPFFMEPILFRQIILKGNYQIDCSCEACEHEWPVDPLLPDILFKCIKCQNPLHLRQHKCHRCFIDYRRSNYQGAEKLLVQKWRRNLNEVSEAKDRFTSFCVSMKLEQTVTDQHCVDICRYIELLEKLAQYPCRALCQAQRVLGHFYYAKASQDLKSHAS